MGIITGKKYGDLRMHDLIDAENDRINNMNKMRVDELGIRHRELLLPWQFVEDSYRFASSDIGQLDRMIKRIIFNDPATIVFWKDGTKTVVKAANEPFSEEKGLAMAIAKRYFGNMSKFKKALKNATRQEKKEAKE